MSVVFDSAGAPFLSLLEQSRAGRKEALDALLEACRRYLLRIASASVPLDLQAKRAPSDLVQESLLVAATHLEQFQGETKQDFLAWLRRILQHRFGHLVWDFRKCSKRAIRREAPLNQSGAPMIRRLEAILALCPSPSEVVLERERDDAIQGALATLTKREQMVMQWHYRERRSFPQIGQLLGCSAEASRSIQRRALRKLAGRLRLWRPE